jgi:glycosyltransferase involved in cell wall biosynthesis
MQDQELPLVSVVIPSYNHEMYIQECIQSVVNQDYPNIELIVIDDGSSDESLNLLNGIKNKYNFKLFAKSNNGVCAAINDGLDHVRGKYIVILAGDDFMPPNRIKEQVNVMSNTLFDVIAGGVTVVDKHSRIIGYKKPIMLGELSLNHLFKGNPIFAPSVMFKKEVFDKFGKYDSSHIVEDYPMWINILSKLGRIAIFDFNWAFYRVDNKEYIKKIDLYYHGLVQTLSKYQSNSVVKSTLIKHSKIYLLKVAIYDGLRRPEIFKILINNKVIPLRAYGTYLLVLLIACLPLFVRKIIQRLISMKLGYYIHRLIFNF